MIFFLPLIAISRLSHCITLIFLTSWPNRKYNATHHTNLNQWTIFISKVSISRHSSCLNLCSKNLSKLIIIQKLKMCLSQKWCVQVIVSLNCILMYFFYKLIDRTNIYCHIMCHILLIKNSKTYKCVTLGN